IVLALVAGFIIDRLIEPNMIRRGVPREYANASAQGLAKKYRADNPYGDSEGSKGGDDQAGTEDRAGRAPGGGRVLIWSMVSALLLTCLIVFSWRIPVSPLRNEYGGFLPEPPLLWSIVFSVFPDSMLRGSVYGLGVGSGRSRNDL